MDAVSLGSAASPTLSAKGQTLGQNDFLRLLTTQLVNQSPLDPMSNEQFVAQMAQFSTATGVAEVNSGIASLREELTANRLSEAAGYIGRTALVSASDVTPGDDGVSGQVQLERDSDALLVNVKNAAGEIVRSLPLGAQSAGSVDFQWDGLTGTGEDAGDGPFFISAESVQSGLVKSAPLYVRGHISSVSMSGSGAQLVVDGVGRIEPSSVVSLS
ncbi:flagellar hook assembly protein FlgD [Pacificimonas flava]|uniref:Basal-body rod modification protein FlgD n=1 Tax=Pacificimonas flava TaxID=1234595 RepID=M2TQU5_9SPHN|nr:flagellar hook capping FlgD N-terminal domain-containing protein [Pacificimonas flava]EMD84166.1 Flagellar basal-body rod modification protein FlgD [Pacificimonas flava]MBB5279956.1 flagellar basal-body rod modification protein FlgD [Pacificimonas flava]